MVHERFAVSIGIHNQFNQAEIELIQRKVVDRKMHFSIDDTDVLVTGFLLFATNVQPKINGIS